MSNRMYNFDFKELQKKNKNIKRTTKDTVFRWINSNKDKVFSIIDQHNDITNNLFSHVDDFFTKNTIKSAYINRDSGIVYIQCMKNKAGNEERFILLNRRITC